jgi:hypothetical protein
MFKRGGLLDPIHISCTDCTVRCVPSDLVVIIILFIVSVFFITKRCTVQFVSGTVITKGNLDVC